MYIQRVYIDLRRPYAVEKNVFFEQLFEDAYNSQELGTYRPL